MSSSARQTAPHEVPPGTRLVLYACLPASPCASGAHRRRPGRQTRFRLGAVGYGPAGTGLAERICTQIRAWSPRTAEPVVTAYPADAPGSDLTDGAVIDRPSVRLVIAY
jgi:hypothetical protein